MLFGSVLILPWLAGYPGFEAVSQRFFGWPFWASWLVFVILLPSAWFAVTTRVFSDWWDEGGVTMANDAAYKQHAEQLNEWRREDTADDERWQQRADTAGSLALAGTVGEGHMAIAVDEEDQLTAPTVTDAES